MKTLLELRGVTKTYREGELLHTVLDRADLQVAEGETVALLGRSGSGKSTLLNLASGIDLPTAGHVRLQGIELNTLSEHQRTLMRRHQIGFIFQFFNLIPTLTVEENLLLPLQLSGKLDRGERSRALSLLDSVGLGHRLGSYPDVLSGGEQQRVAIVRALAHDPVLILADEPTGNLDADTAEDVLELLRRSLRDRRKTLVMATHGREAAAIADRVLRVEDGGLVEHRDGHDR